MSRTRAITRAVEDYLRHLELHGYSELTLRQRKSQLKRFRQWCLDRELTHPKQVTKAHVGQYQRHLFLAKKRNGEPLSRRSQNHLLSALTVFFRCLVKMGRLSKDPTVHLEPPKFDRNLPKSVLTPREVAKVLDGIDVDTPLGLRDRALLETLYSTGIRAGEVAALDEQDVDPDRGTVTVVSGKGGKDRVVPIGQRALRWIEKYQVEVRPKWLRRDDETTLFITIRGKKMHRGWVSELASRRISASGIKKKGSAHSFRHAMATAMLDAGADIRHIQAILGHTFLSTTQIYTRVSIEKLKKVHEKTHPAKWKKK